MSFTSKAIQHASESRTDDLTGLVNRRGFRERLESIPRDLAYAIISLDVDGQLATPSAAA